MVEWLGALLGWRAVVTRKFVAFVVHGVGLSGAFGIKLFTFARWPLAVFINLILFIVRKGT